MRPAIWPAYSPAPVERRLAVYAEGTIVTEDGGALSASGWDEIRGALFVHNLLLLCGPIGRQAWLPEAIADPGTQVLVSHHAACSVRVTHGARVRWIVPISAWFEQRTPEFRLLRTLRAVFDRLGTGPRPTPSSTGLALAAALFPDDEARLWRPNRWTWQTLHDSLIAGRSEVCGALGRRYPVAWGQDRTMAYPAIARGELPAGTAIRYDGEPPRYAHTWYQWVHFSIPSRVLLGPLPHREQSGNLVYPVGMGCWGWYWREEVEDALAVGARVISRRAGYAWDRASHGLAPWAEALYAHRMAAPGEEATLIKRIAVSAVGRYAVGYESAEMVAYAPGGDPYIGPDEDYVDSSPYRLQTTSAPRDAMLMAQALYIWMQQRRALYARALPYAMRGSLIGTNIDEVLMDERPLEPGKPGLGEWKDNEYTDLHMDHKRWKEARGVQIRPGVRRNDAEYHISA